jgi:hypothetical protein
VIDGLRRTWLRNPAVQAAGGFTLAGGLALGLAIGLSPEPASVRATAAPVRVVLSPTPAQAAEDVVRLQDLTPEAARLWNAANPVSTLPNPPARPFRLQAASVLDEARAVDCLTAAVYYEAAWEGADGQRAVAQVVLNRLRHPAYPKSVCGVVFQGAERRAGCQFTFTCDGSLARRPEPAAWDRARRVAQDALSGRVMKTVGNATHYHADYVAPYWSPGLVKVAVVGAHVFYRWTGSSGLPPAFAGRYQGGETALQAARLDALAGPPAKIVLTSAEAAPPVQAPAVEPASRVETVSAPHEELVVPMEAAAALAEPQELAKDIDWTGRPKPAAPPRLAMPTQGTARLSPY